MRLHIALLLSLLETLDSYMEQLPPMATHDKAVHWCWCGMDSKCENFKVKRDEGTNSDKIYSIHPYLSVAIQTHPCCIDVLYCHQLVVLQYYSWLSNYTEGTWHGFTCRCNNSHDSVIYGRATQTSITVVSMFPRKTWGATHAQTVDTRYFYLIFFWALGNKARKYPSIQIFITK